MLLLLRSLHHDHDKKETCFYFNTTFITQLSWGKYCSIFSLRKFSVSKRFVRETAVSPSGTSAESLSIFLLRKLSVFKRFVHDTLVSTSGTSLESYMLYYPKIHYRNCMHYLNCSLKKTLSKLLSRKRHYCNIYFWYILRHNHQKKFLFQCIYSFLKKHLWVIIFIFYFVFTTSIWFRKITYFIYLFYQSNY